MKISIVVPVYNESLRLPTCLNEIKAYVESHSDLDIELIVYDDGSVDDTMEIIKSSKIISRYAGEGHFGKGHALREGLRLATGEYFYLCDVDLSAPIQDLDNFLKYADQFDCVLGSRAVEKSIENRGFIKKLMGRVGNFLINLFLGLNIKDTQCGFKLINRRAREIFLKNEIDGFGYDFEFLQQARREGLSMIEIPVKWTQGLESRVTSVDYPKTLLELWTVWRSGKKKR